MTATDLYTGGDPAEGFSADKSFSITPHDTNELSFVTTYVFVTGAGNLNVVLEGMGSTATAFNGLAAGTMLPLRCKIVKATGTSATGIIGLYATQSNYSAITAPLTYVAYTPVTSGQNGVAYTGATPTPRGGVAPYTYTSIGGALPTGITLDSSTGVLSGTPSVSGSFPLQLRATDTDGHAYDIPAFTLAIAP